MINSIRTQVPGQNELQKSLREEKINEIRQEHQDAKARQFVQVMSQIQSSLGLKAIEGDTFVDKVQEFKDFLSGIGYEGKSIASLSQEEAAELVSEDGFFGVKQTSVRISDFVIMGAGGDEKMLREGKKGILQGFEDAEKIWGEKLPDIAYETIDKAVAMIDKALIEGGFSLIDEKA